MKRFDEWMEAALYSPGGGFYERGGAAGGARGDFITSPEVGPLFGAVVARAVAGLFEELGIEHGHVVEVGAGRGALAVSMLTAGLPEGCRYVAVERSAALRVRAGELLGDRAEVVASLDEAVELLGGGAIDGGAIDGGAIGGGAIDGETFDGETFDGEIFDGVTFDGVIVANELLDNLPFRILERTDEGWADLHVVDDGHDDRPQPRPVLLRESDRNPVGFPQQKGSGLGSGLGTRLPVIDAASSWVDDARRRLRRGRVIAFDYGVATTAELVDRPWLRTYVGHQRGDDPFAATTGTCDITTDIAIDQLPTPTSAGTQAEWLRRHGIDDLVAEGKAVWAERAHLGDLEAIRARSRVNEAEALLDPAGLGAFLVTEWDPAP